MVDIDADTVAALRVYRATCGSLTHELVPDAALVLGNLDGTHRHPERYSRRIVEQVVQARKALGEDLLPVIRLHDLRHTHATLLLADGVPVKVVSERLGHASATITLTVYQHVHPGMGREAADRFGGAARGLIRRAKYHAGITRASEAPTAGHPGLLTCRNTEVRLCPRGDMPHTHTPIRRQLRETVVDLYVKATESLESVDADPDR